MLLKNKNTSGQRCCSSEISLFTPFIGIYTFGANLKFDRLPQILYIGNSVRKMRKKISQIARNIIKIYFDFNRNLISSFSAQNETVNEEQFLFLATRIINYAAVIIILVVFILSIIHLTSDNSADIDTNANIFVLYLVSILFVVGGGLFSKILPWRHRAKSALGIFSRHGFRTTWFTIPAVLSFVMWRFGTNFLIVLPAICISAAVMALTFPTRKRWKKWMGGNSLLDYK